MTAKDLEINCRIAIGKNFGTVRYIGQVQGYVGNWVGVEWDDPDRGKHCGTVNGIEYYKTSTLNSGSMVRVEKIPMFETLYDAIAKKYTDKETFEIDQQIIKEVQKKFHASIFEVVGMEKIGNKQSNLSFLVDVSVSFQTINRAGNLSIFKNLKSLDISSTLIWNWGILSDITRQVSTLSEIYLANNRLLIPSNTETQIYAASFTNLKKLNLRNCNICDWNTVVHLAKMWPELEFLSLEDNRIEFITEQCYNHIFRRLKTLDIQSNNINDKESFTSLAKIKSLESILLMKNSITKLELPDCEYDKKVKHFPNLRSINLRDNPIMDDCLIFNELDKLMSLEHLSIDVKPEVGYDETFSRAVGLISNLKTFNKTLVLDTLRRDSECDIWKKYASEWCSVKNSDDKRRIFLNNHRCYEKIVLRLGDPEQTIPTTNKKSTMINLSLLNSETGETKSKRVPKRINLQTLKNLIIKLHNIPNKENFRMFLLDKERNVHIDLDNCNKSLDFYSIDENDTIEFSAC